MQGKVVNFVGALYYPFHSSVSASRWEAGLQIIKSDAGIRHTMDAKYPRGVAEKCPKETLVALTWEAIFDQFPSLIRDEIRGSYRTKAVIFDQIATGNFRHTGVIRITSQLDKPRVH